MKILNLGDSYTIGEGVPLYESFPYLLVQRLRKKGIAVSAPEIIAKTGWTTHDLLAKMDEWLLPSSFDLVTLLIGVNNQYRGLLLDEYEVEFRELLRRAISFCRSGSGGVVVLSVPDWGVTPYAAGRDAAQIAKEINKMNALNAEIAKESGCGYIDITAGTRLAKNDVSLLAADGLHYSVKEHERWAGLIAEKIELISN